MGMHLLTFLLVAAMLRPPSHSALAECSTAQANEKNPLALISPVPEAAVRMRPFGTRRDPVTGLVMMSTALTWRVPEGSSVRASLAGFVFSVRKQQTGYSIVLDHKEGLRSVYRGLEAPLVRAGACVEQKALLGRASGGQIAFSLMRNGRLLDPLSFISDSSHKDRHRKPGE